MRRGSVKAGCNVGVRIPSELYNKIKIAADEHNMSASELVRGILEEACRLRLALLERRRKNNP